MKNLINESEKNRILKLYNLPTNDNYVFDFVLTEDNKYLIIMDQVFVNGHNGNTIGSIWENLHIFNEIVNENIKTLNEDIKRNVNVFLSEITWEKKQIISWLNEDTIINEESLLDTIKSGVSNVAKTIFKQGVIPFLRWIRRNSMTDIGMVVDTVVAILSMKSSAIVWILIVLLDIYEIYTGDYDPKEYERSQLPFFYLISDVIAVLFSAGPALLFRKAIPSIVKNGAKSLNPTTFKLLTNIINKIPFLKTTLKTNGNVISKKMNNPTIFGKIISGIDVVLDKLLYFLKMLIKSIKTGVITLGATKAVDYGINYGIEKLDFGSTLQSGVETTDSYLSDKVKQITNKKDIGQLKVSPETETLIRQRMGWD